MFKFRKEKIESPEIKDEKIDDTSEEDVKLKGNLVPDEKVVK